MKIKIKNDTIILKMKQKSEIMKKQTNENIENPPKKKKKYEKYQYHHLALSLKTKTNI